jgi:dTDP-4-dehydrorhamnose reductase
MQRVLITGANGQLGHALRDRLPAGLDARFAGRAELDISDENAVQATLAQWRPDVVINAAAYTAVDRAEQEWQLALAANGTGPGHLAAACARQGTRLVHVSTDFVFDGCSGRPYRPDDVPAPLSAYGRSKLAGEAQVAAALPDAVILRTGWVYSCRGGNFVNTMLRLMAERRELNVVVDQVGTPTWADGLARAAWAAAGSAAANGIYHFSDAGACSWYDFACAIVEEACALGLLARKVRVNPISTEQYPTPARRPAYSVLDKQRCWTELGLAPVHWREQLRRMLVCLQREHDG